MILNLPISITRLKCLNLPQSTIIYRQLTVIPYNLHNYLNSHSLNFPTLTNANIFIYSMVSMSFYSAKITSSISKLKISLTVTINLHPITIFPYPITLFFHLITLKNVSITSNLSTSILAIM